MKISNWDEQRNEVVGCVTVVEGEGEDKGDNKFLAGFSIGMPTEIVEIITGETDGRKAVSITVNSRQAVRELIYMLDRVSIQLEDLAIGF